MLAKGTYDNVKLHRKNGLKFLGIAGVPCCGLAGKIDVLEGHLVPVSHRFQGNTDEIATTSNLIKRRTKHAGIGENNLRSTQSFGKNNDLSDLVALGCSGHHDSSISRHIGSKREIETPACLVRGSINASDKGHVQMDCKVEHTTSLIGTTSNFYAPKRKETCHSLLHNLDDDKRLVHQLQISGHVNYLQKKNREEDRFVTPAASCQSKMEDSYCSSSSNRKEPGTLLKGTQDHDTLHAVAPRGGMPDSKAAQLRSDEEMNYGQRQALHGGKVLTTSSIQDGRRGYAVNCEGLLLCEYHTNDIENIMSPARSVHQHLHGRKKRSRSLTFEQRWAAEKRVSIEPSCSCLQNEVLPDSNYGLTRAITGMQSEFNMGFGIGVVCMLSANRKEAERFDKLLQQTEALVKNTKQQVQCEKCQFADPLSSNLGIENPEIQKHEVTKVCGQFEDVAIDVEAYDTCIQGEDLAYVQITAGESKSRHMLELQAALEAELELMQLNLSSSNAEESVSHSHEWCCITSPHLPSSSYGLSRQDYQGEVGSLDELQKANFPVSPGTLKSRLHELLEARQEEKILELEAELKAKETDLLVKEKELQCWKDVALRLVEAIQGKSGTQARTYVENAPLNWETVSQMGYGSLHTEQEGIGKQSAHIPDEGIDDIN